MLKGMRRGGGRRGRECEGYVRNKAYINGKVACMESYRESNLRVLERERRAKKNFIIPNYVCTESVLSTLHLLNLYERGREIRSITLSHLISS